MSLLLLLFSFLSFSDGVVYYISADCATSDTCVDSSNATLRPCYSLQQLSNGNGLLVNKTSITLRLLSGTHILPENCTLLLSNVGEVEISPWNQQQKELIKCYTGANITFQHIKILSILSLNFTHCVLFINHVFEVSSNFKAHALINRCVFAESKGDYAIIIPGTSIKFTISINNCIFLSNNGAISCDCGLCNKNIILFIRNTMFFNNTRTTGYDGALSFSYIDLELHGSSFVNNTAISGGALSMESCSALIRNTHFLNNYASSNGGAISQSSSHLCIEHCLFKSNYAEFHGGAIWSLGQEQLSIGDTNFLENFVAGSGGAIYSDSIEINSCQFKSNYAAESGGACYFFDVEKGRLSHSLFYLNKARIDGGAIYFEQSQRGYFEYVVLTGGNATMNSARNGGFFCSMSSTVFIRGTYYIGGNKATNGGAIFISNSIMQLPEAEFKNIPECSLINNTAEASGGGIYAVNSHIILNPYMGKVTMQLL